VALVSESKEETHEGRRFRFARRGAFGCHLDITGIGAVKSAAEGRDGAMCLSEAERHYPGRYKAWDNVQSFSFRSCMHDAGYID